MLLLLLHGHLQLLPHLHLSAEGRLLGAAVLGGVALVKLRNLPGHREGVSQALVWEKC